jgi:hypothetical protein
MALDPRFRDELLTWEEIEAAFIARLEMPADAFYALAEQYRGLAFTVRKVSDMQTLHRIKRRLEQIIASGGQVAEFLEWVEGEALGWSDAYSGLVFRQNVFSAAAKGRWDEINDPDVAAEFGWLMYDAVDDDRTRASHAAMDNLAWRKAEFPQEWYPPNGYSCRCDVRNLNDDLMRRAGADPQGSSPPPDDPDEGFRANQAAALRETLDAELERLRGELAQ